MVCNFRFASTVLKRKCEEAGSSRTTLKTGGKPIQVSLGPAPKEKRQLTHEDMANLQSSAMLTKEQTLDVAASLRIVTGDRNFIQSHLKEALTEKNKSIDDFFEFVFEDGKPLVRAFEIM